MRKGLCNVFTGLLSLALLTSCGASSSQSDSVTETSAEITTTTTISNESQNHYTSTVKEKKDSYSDGFFDVNHTLKVIHRAGCSKLLTDSDENIEVFLTDISPLTDYEPCPICKPDISESAVSTTTIVSKSKEKEDYYEIYETLGIMYQIPASWEEVHTDKNPAKYKKFKADDFSFSVQVFDNNYNLGDSTDQLITDVESYFTKANVSELYLDSINGVECIFFTLVEKSDPNQLTFKIACQASDAVVYFNFFDSQDQKSLKKQRDDFAKSISGNIPFPTSSENKETTMVTTIAKKKEGTTATLSFPKSSLRESNAQQLAKDYLKSSAFSYEGMIDQLEFEGYTHDEAVYGAENCGADWNDQALKSALEYLNSSPFSYNGLIKQLEYSKFTHDQAVYGANYCGADWNQQAAKQAQDYIDMMTFSRESLIQQLEYEGFTTEQAAYGASAVGF